MKRSGSRRARARAAQHRQERSRPQAQSTSRALLRLGDELIVHSVTMPHLFIPYLSPSRARETMPSVPGTTRAARGFKKRKRLRRERKKSRAQHCEVSTSKRARAAGEPAAGVSKASSLVLPPPEQARPPSATAPFSGRTRRASRAPHDVRRVSLLLPDAPLAVGAVPHRDLPPRAAPAERPRHRC